MYLPNQLAHAANVKAPSMPPTTKLLCASAHNTFISCSGNACAAHAFALGGVEGLEGVVFVVVFVWNAVSEVALMEAACEMFVCDIESSQVYASQDVAKKSRMI